MNCVVFVAVIIAAVCASASAFILKTPAAKTAASRVAMKLPADSSVFKRIALSTALLPMVLPCAVLAAEGTGRAFGFDDSRLIWAAVTPALLILPLYAKWSKEQEPDDFFDGYEKRRNG